jgi:hypothetical protein
VVEGARLESVYTGNGIAGSNPALSAKNPAHAGFFIYTRFCSLLNSYLSLLLIDYTL